MVRYAEKAAVATAARRLQLHAFFGSSTNW
jgi:hypothetical protein